MFCVALSHVVSIFGQLQVVPNVGHFFTKMLQKFIYPAWGVAICTLIHLQENTLFV